MSLIKAGRPLKVLGFDIENRPSAYWYDGQATAEITAICWKLVSEEEPHAIVLRADGRWLHDDQRRTLANAAGLRLFAKVLAGADLVFGHNIRRHDLPIFQASLLRLGMPTLDPVLTCDTLSDYPKRKAKSASLENIAAELGLDLEKHHMGIVAWERANRLEPDGLNETWRRVVGDVLLQEKLRDRLLELDYLSAPKRWFP